ncbi:PAS domain S-box-containing protein [Pricia antarctica]|uniref:histidine kinase n=1 Tax=Pricia antarctica TaxID=641691 RepID=A0A1G6Y8M7_9FLAO|nr:PAS domain S-box protein [Pricia antarctica]SDD85936.1 PAS domain S-box-containing protein [Pricia antarctica]
MTDGFEKKRLQDLKSMKLLDTLPEKEYDDLTNLAAFICDTPISLVTLVTNTRQFFKSHHGISITETPIELSFCAHALKTPLDVFIVEDARNDMRFKDNPLVKGEPNVVFYAGMPLVSSEGNALGTLCVVDMKPRKLEQKQLEALRSLANQVTHLFELRKNRMEIERSEKRFKGLVQSGSDLIAILDFEANYQYVSPTSVNVLGIAPEEFVGKNALEFIHPDDKEAAYASLLRLENEKQLTLKPFRFKHGDGSWRWIETIITNLTDDPAISGLVANSRDITTRITSEKAIKESERRYSDLFHLSPQPMWVYDIDTLKFLDVNKAAIKHYGHSYEEFLNMTIRKIRPETEIIKLEANLKLSQQKEKHYTHGEYVHRKKNGEEIIVDIRTNILSYKGKKAKVVLVTDITERYKYMQAMEAQNEKLKKIAWTQSHVVRAPLARIMGLIDLLKEDSPSVDQKEKEQLLEHIFQSATEFDEIIRNIVNTTQHSSENYTLGE